MSACSSTCYNHRLLIRNHPYHPNQSIHYLIYFLSDLLAFLLPVASTFLATLNMIPIARQVNKKLLPPILTSGSVTPVTGNKFTVTAIFAIACITSVKLNPNARNAPKAKGHLLKNPDTPE